MSGYTFVRPTSCFVVREGLSPHSSTYDTFFWGFCVFVIMEHSDEWLFHANYEHVMGSAVGAVPVYFGCFDVFEGVFLLFGHVMRDVVLDRVV